MREVFSNVYLLIICCLLIISIKLSILISDSYHNGLEKVLANQEKIISSQSALQKILIDSKKLSILEKNIEKCHKYLEETDKLIKETTRSANLNNLNVKNELNILSNNKIEIENELKKLYNIRKKSFEYLMPYE